MCYLGIHKKTEEESTYVEKTRLCIKDSICEGCGKRMRTVQLF